jgi:hypothetical protein
MNKTYLFGLLFLSMPVFASDWQMTYHSPQSLLIDKDSIVEIKGSVKKFWTLYAPKITMGQPGEGYAYSKVLHLISCTARTAAITQTIYYDENQVPHDSIVEDKAMQDIVPDSRDDYLWKYVCKPDQQAELAAPAGKGGISRFLEDQVKFTKENDRLWKKTNGQ